MRKIIFLLLLSGACKQDSYLDGAYTFVAAKHGESTLSKDEVAEHKILKNFKNRHWLAVTYSGNSKIAAKNAIGGTCTIKDGKYKLYTQNLNFI